MSDDKDPTENELDDPEQTRNEAIDGPMASEELPADEAPLSEADAAVEPDALGALPPSEESGLAEKRPVSDGVLRGDEGTETAQVWISAFLIAALGFLVYLYAFNIPLHGDDLALFGEGSPLGRISTSLDALPHMPTGPLSIVGLALNNVIGGQNLDILHGASILFHILCAILVFFIARRLLPSGTPEAVAMLAGMLFVVHPITSESVNYLVARPVLQSTFFGLAALLLLLRGWSLDGPRVASLIAAVTCFMLAFGSDTSAIFFPLIGCLLVYFQGSVIAGPRDFRGVVASVLLLTTAFMWVAGEASGLFESVRGHDGLVTSLSGILSEAGHGLFYGILPTKFSLLPIDGGLVYGLVAMVVLGALIVGGMLKERFVASIGLWIVLALIGVAFFGPSEAVGPTRYAYAPWAALCMLAPWLFQRLRAPQLRVAGSIVAAVVILGLASLSFQRCGVWTQPIEVWAAEEVTHPGSVRPSLERGRFIMTRLNSLSSDNDQKSGLLEQAQSAWENVMAADPDHIAEARKNLGVLAMEQQDYTAALEHLQFAAAHLPGEQDVALYRAYAAEQQARTTNDQQLVVEALRSLNRARAMGTLPQLAMERYGLLAMQIGDLQTGLYWLERAARNNPSEAITESLNRGRLLAEQVTNLEAQADGARQTDPRGTTVVLIQAQRYLLEGQTMKAFYILEMLMAREPDNRAVWSLLGLTSARIGGANNFLAEWGGQISDWDAWKQLAMRCAGLGAWPAAEVYLRQGTQQPLSNAPLPELALADLAMELNQGQRAIAYVQAAQKAYPDHPEPWLRLAGMALTAGDKETARKLVAEAEKRQADPGALKALTDQLGPAPTQQGITRTVIQ